MRVSGQSATIEWISLTRNETRGVLITIQVAMLTKHLSQACLLLDLDISNDSYAETLQYNVTEDVMQKSMITITSLEPTEEYCIAIQVINGAGKSGYSDPLQLSCELFWEIV